jgi:hypothetical protein
VEWRRIVGVGDKVEEGDMVIVECDKADDGTHSGLIMLFIDATHFVLSDEVDGCANAHSVEQIMTVI